MNGVLVIDKPKGPTSHDVVSEVKSRLRARKVGHLGTLDPLATGVLPLVINNATKLSPYLEGGTKGYLATMKLGTETDTYDVEGKVIKTRDTGSITEHDVVNALRSFMGRITQVPPMFSSVKRSGTPLYKLARKGVFVERSAKEVEVFSLKVLDVKFPSVTFKVFCSRGTYVRTLVHDAGLRLGCGAHLAGLRRVRSGVFTIDEALGLEVPDGLLLRSIIPVEAALERTSGELKSIDVDDEEALRIRNGNPSLGKGKKSFFPSLKDGEVVRFVHNKSLLALATYRGEGSFKVQKVFTVN